jgi:type III restriction enzyme
LTGSPDQVTQIVGRVLRQPGAQHYASSNLNKAHFYIRTDERGVFEAILADVERKLAAESPEIGITVRRETHGGNKPYKEPLRPRQVPTVSVDSTYAHPPVAAIVEGTNNYRNDTDNTVGKGGRIQVLQTIGEGASAVEEWVEVAHSNRVTARWVMRREVQRLVPSRGDREHNPINLCDIEDPRFDALIEYSSRAAEHIREQARKIVDAYIEHSTIVQNALDEPYTVGSVLVDETKMVRFRNAVHEGYSDLNPSLERPFAEALDKTRRVWCRNPSAGGFSIPLLDHGNTRTFRPDFLVWVDNQIMAIDTKGPHLLTVDVMRKLFFIDKLEEGPELVIRMVSEGTWHVAPTGLFSRTGGSSGEYSVWIQRQGRAHVTPCRNLSEAVDVCLRTDVGKERQRSRLHTGVKPFD